MTYAMKLLLTAMIVAACWRPIAGETAPEAPKPNPSTTAETSGNPVVFHMQLWDAQKTGWRPDKVADVAKAGFTILQNGWNGSLFPSRGLLDRLYKHGLLYGAYIDTRYLFRKRATAEEKSKVRMRIDYYGNKVNEYHTLDPVYQSVVRREMKKGLKDLEGTPGLFKILFNSEHRSHVSYDELTEAATVAAGAMKAGEKMPRYKRGVYNPPLLGAPENEADPVVFRRWFDSAAGDVAINTIAADATRAARPGTLCTTDPINDGYTYGQFDAMEILQNWLRVHRAPRDPLTVAYHVERLKAHLRHKGDGQIWIGPQLGSKTSAGNYAAPADEFEEALWLAVAFGGRGITCWGYDTVRFDNALDIDTWGRIRKFRDKLLSKYSWVLEAKDAPRKCAVLLSKANLVLAGRVYHEVEANYEHFYRVLLTAHVPTDVVYDDDVLAGALSRYKALFLPGITKLTPAIKDKIRAFAAAGGRVVYFPFLKISYLDYEITKGNFNEKLDVEDPGSYTFLPHQYRQWRHIQARRVFAKVEDLMNVHLDNPDVIMNILLHNGRPRLVLVNDARTYGPWTLERGHRWAEDKGLASEVTITITRPSGAERSVTVKIDPASICTLSL